MAKIFISVLVLLMSLAERDVLAECSFFLQAETIFDLDHHEVEQYTKIKSIYRKLLSTQTPNQRRQVRLSEYKSDFEHLQATLKIWKHELEQFSLYFEIADADPIPSDGSSESISSAMNSPKIETRMRFSIRHLGRVLDSYQNQLAEGSIMGPTYSEVLFAGNFFAKLNAILMALRKLIPTWSHSPYGVKNLNHYPTLMVNLFVDFFDPKPIDSTKSTVSHLKKTIRNYAKTKLPDRQWIVIPVPIFQTHLMSFNVISELSTMNLNIEQTVTDPIVFFNLDGLKGEHDSNHLQSHDDEHTIAIKLESEEAVLNRMTRYSNALKPNHSQWLQFLKLLVFYHRHEVNEKISSFPKDLCRYLKTYRGANALYRDLEKRIHDDLKDVVSPELFDQEWNRFIRFLMELPEGASFR